MNELIYGLITSILFGFFLIMIWSKSGDSGEIEIGFDQYQRSLHFKLLV